MNSENNYNNSNSTMNANNDNTEYRQEAGNPRQETNTERPSTNYESGNQNLNQNDNRQKKDRVPSKGIAGFMESNFGADKTTTSTFEKSQGEKFGANFDDTGDKLKENYGDSKSQIESAGDAKASGSARHGEHTTEGNRGNKAGAGANASQGKGHETGTHKEGFGQKLKHRAEGRLIGHKYQLTLASS
ncbi:hypothetical protein UA08_01653 [Talaromyces atroroseus]|uniref:Uncharacterized protein n=1 Tax=Talaromyces atroroseus TaxID=1441469 RepID=A0A1Q5Q9N1_TALAT|nr:hypothetical protein UA08_01653 [Talaromyces atroroseus]OKL62646.1 hypothetical protein UA08_01653 [Talaromyces atroroseus]